MISEPMDVLKEHPVRKGRKKKKLFRKDVKDYFTELGYKYSEEKGDFGAINLVAGDPVNAKYLITAHYDTCAFMPFPNLITPCNFLIYILYQLLITVLLLLPGAVIGVAAGILFKDYSLGMQLTGMISFLVIILIFVGPANKNNSNDNTSGVVTLLEIAKSLPDLHRDKVCFVLFDLEEAGLVGSSAYRNKHKTETNHQIVLNLDCVGDGDEIYFFPTRKLRKDLQMLESLQLCCGSFGKKNVTVRKKGFSVYPSDQSSFPYGIGICALHKNKLCLYLGRIHTVRDTVLDETNVNILRAALISYITCTTNKKGNE